MEQKYRNISKYILALFLFVYFCSYFNTDVQAANQYAYFAKATSITTQGGSETKNYTGNPAQTGSGTYKTYSNTTADNNIYVIFENAVKAANENYDLVIYPFKGSKDVSIMLSAQSEQWNKSPAVRSPSSGYAFYKMVITKHGQINNAVSMKILFGCSDLDGGEYVGLPSSFEGSHIGSNISKKDITSPMVGKKYVGTKESTTNKMAMTTNCIVGTINIPSTGMVICYGSKDGRAATFAFDEILDYWGDDIIPDEYKIQFNANGGSGSVPSTITKDGTDTSVVMGDISSTIPTRSGYIFKGWSASSLWNSKRIAYSSSYGGETAKDGTSATTTSSSWSFSDYCNYTGSSTSSRTLTLYAQWERDVNEYKIQFNANSGSGSVPSTITKEGTDTSVVMGDISSTVPTRSGYIFKGWSASSSWNSKRIAYSSSSGGGAASDGTSAKTTSSSWSYATYCENTGGDSSSKTLTLYAQWEYAPSYTHTLAYNANGGSNAPSSSTVTNTSSTYNMTVSSVKPTRTGYTFSGWNTNSSGTGTDYSAGGSVPVGPNATVMLYAKWTLNNSTLEVNPNGGTWNGSLNEQSFTQNYNTTKDIPVPTRTGYTFTGWKRSGTNGTMSSLTDAATYTFGPGNNVTDIIIAEWKANNYMVTYIDRIKGTDTRLGEPQTAQKPYGSTVRGSDLGSDTMTGKYHVGYYYVSDTSAIVTTNGATVYRDFNPQDYDVTYIDVVKKTGEELGRQTKPKAFNSTARGSDLGSNTEDNAYYNNYRYLEDSGEIIVETEGNIVYRYFEYITLNVDGSVQWVDHDNEYGTRPDSCTVRIYRDGEFIDSVIVSASDNINKYSFKNLPKYDLTTGEEYAYTVTQDEVLSQASLEGLEDKYTTEQNKYDFKNTIRNIEKPGPNPPPEDKGFHVEGNIYWEDNDDSLGFRPSTITITLYQKGEDGEWHPYKEPIIVDSKTENHYLFDWLPKYWYGEDGEPTAYEYKVEETLVAWYVENGIIKDAYTIIADQPNDFDFTNVFNKPGEQPIIPTTEYENTLIVKTNTEEEVKVILKPLELYINEDYTVTYEDETGNDIPLLINKTGEIVNHIPSTRYEIVVDSSEYTVEDISLSLEENMKLEQIDDKWYITIENQPEDAFGTIEIDLAKKETYYQFSKRLNNYFACDNQLKNNPFIRMMSTFIAAPGEAVTIKYEDTLADDSNWYSVGEEAEILDYLGMIPDGKEFIGWSKQEDSDTAEYYPGDRIEIEDSMVLYPVFEMIGLDIDEIEQ